MNLYEKYVFGPMLDALMGQWKMGTNRERLLAEARGEVLEIGFGTGLNLPFYPDAVERLTVVDPNDLLHAKVERRIRESKIPVERKLLDAAHLPFENQRFDCVVSTWTLCTIPDVEHALREAFRVLKPGGQLLFVEHVRSINEKVARRQDQWNFLQRIVGCGCNLNRPVEQLVRTAGFDLRRSERFLLPDSPRIIAEHQLGYARRPA